MSKYNECLKCGSLIDKDAKNCKFCDKKTVHENKFEGKATSKQSKRQKVFEVLGLLVIGIVFSNLSQKEILTGFMGNLAGTIGGVAGLILFIMLIKWLFKLFSKKEQ